MRLVGGATDPGNAWAYGRPQVFHSGAYSTLIKRFSFSLPRNSSQVMCRSLGFAAGGGVISSHEDNSASALPGHPGETKFVDFVRCNGDEADVSQCAVGVDPAALNSEEDAGSGGRFDVGVVCVNPSGVAAIAPVPAAAPGPSPGKAADETSRSPRFAEPWQNLTITSTSASPPPLFHVML